MVSVEQPYIEMSFYFIDGQRRKQYLDSMISELLKLGASFTEACTLIKRINNSVTPIVNAYDEALGASDKASIDIASWKQILHDPSNYLLEVGMLNSAGFESNLLESVGDSYITYEYIKKDHPPLSIAMSYENIEKQRKDKTVKESSFSIRFRHLSNVLKPAYSAICYIDPLPCLSELKERFFYFQDFFINKDLISEEALSRIKSIYKDAYILDMTNGVYISTSPDFNPNKIWLKYREEFFEIWKILGREIGN